MLTDPLVVVFAVLSALQGIGTTVLVFKLFQGMRRIEKKLTQPTCRTNPNSR